MYIPHTVLRVAHKTKNKLPAALFAGAAAVICSIQTAGVAVACGVCLLHEAAPVAPVGNPEIVAQPGIMPYAVAGFIGIALVSAIAYGTRRMLAQKERGQ